MTHPDVLPLAGVAGSPMENDMKEEWNYLV